VVHRPADGLRPVVDLDALSASALAACHS
jgi:hypothetical protein